ncbi:MAG TPA: DHH family phosphoesterase [Bacteroidales bacterium]|nr:DHH family phosphoesterase [Bacteroidales bacterium]HKM12857.1 DHH family phosphoesterase [Bacteroidales bacterium]HPB88559.1 DHH family phosphoesterase [Bacteroidales bacterium]HPY21456.1 DHH family phosphoesterase [Bacteroidales bacterium]HQA92458.1 DHH family phosphoesterase [Bacteroidales bacterium]
MKKRFDTTHLEKMLSASKRPLLVGHFNPDGDAVGSLAGMFHYLRDRGMTPSALLPSPYPDYLAFLIEEGIPITIHSREDESAGELIASADLLICFDFNRLSRTEHLEDDILASKAPKVLIDHHPLPEVEHFDLVYSEIDLSSSCELLFWILMSMSDVDGDVSRLSLRCAESLYVGMMTDTNNFYNSVSASTFEMASLLTGAGVDKTRLQECVYNNYSVDRMRLMGHLLKDCLHVIEDCGVAYLLLSAADKRFYNFAIGDSEGFVNLPLSIMGIRISALFSELDCGQDKYIRVSLRSKGDLDVNRFAALYCNGGGHLNAAGGRLYMPFEEVGPYIEKSFREYLKIG